ncbi:hypothetical protein ABZ814_06125 [Micromonospora musae]|uniref:hypothetical protein n=1 Tax=Micromonospora musae TaxID=1894970 RepID=UPI00340A654C
MDEKLRLSNAWWDLRVDGTVEREQRQALHQELLIEVAAGHPLHRRPVIAVAKSEASDDIVVHLPTTGEWARVHLTWKRAAETPPWPKTEFYETVEDLERTLTSRTEPKG